MSEFESHEVEIEVDLAAFLPEGTTFDADGAEPEGEPGAEGGPEAAASSIDLEALDQLERDLDAVDAAIAALDAGTYGIDPSTGEPIDDALLAADPTRLS